jgi:hypothetical protein
MSRLTVFLLAIVAALVAVLSSPRALHHVPLAPAVAPTEAPASGPAAEAATPAAPVHPEIGFRSEERLAEHWRKHGREFGAVTVAGYLRLAQSLRDRPAVAYPPPPGSALAPRSVLEAVRGDGVVTRFDRASGAFLACDADGTIRTFFKPHDGEAYFRRQLERAREAP